MWFSAQIIRSKAGKQASPPTSWMTSPVSAMRPELAARLAGRSSNSSGESSRYTRRAGAGRLGALPAEPPRAAAAAAGSGGRGGARAGSCAAAAAARCTCCMLSAGAGPPACGRAPKSTGLPTSSR
jgi:hypothetical protein